LYVKEELIENFEQPFIGWASVKPEVFETLDLWDIWNLRLSENASRFEVGSPSAISFIGASEAIKMLLKLGIRQIEERVLKLTDRLINSLKALGLQLQTPEDPNCRSGIINFKVKNLKEIMGELRRKDIIVSARANGIRVSPHFYNTEEEIDKLVNEVKRCINV
ncbi:MAG: aminotransferase class V-fold PLP-dependent enzyme, partial [Candidatus Bathyarchaeia archaeon]